MKKGKFPKKIMLYLLSTAIGVTSISAIAETSNSTSMDVFVNNSNQTQITPSLEKNRANLTSSIPPLPPGLEEYTPKDTVWQDSNSVSTNLNTSENVATMLTSGVHGALFAYGNKLWSTYTEPDSVVSTDAYGGSNAVVAFDYGPIVNSTSNNSLESNILALVQKPESVKVTANENGTQTTTALSDLYYCQVPVVGAPVWTMNPIRENSTGMANPIQMSVNWNNSNTSSFNSIALLSNDEMGESVNSTYTPIVNNISPSFPAGTVFTKMQYPFFYPSESTSGLPNGLVQAYLSTTNGNYLVNTYGIGASTGNSYVIDLGKEVYPWYNLWYDIATAPNPSCPIFANTSNPVNFIQEAIYPASGNVQAFSTFWKHSNDTTTTPASLVWNTNPLVINGTVSKSSVNLNSAADLSGTTVTTAANKNTYTLNSDGTWSAASFPDSTDQPYLTNANLSSTSPYSSDYQIKVVNTTNLNPYINEATSLLYTKDANGWNCTEPLEYAAAITNNIEADMYPWGTNQITGLGINWNEDNSIASVAVAAGTINNGDSTYSHYVYVENNTSTFTKQIINTSSTQGESAFTQIVSNYLPVSNENNILCLSSSDLVYQYYLTSNSISTAYTVDTKSLPWGAASKGETYQILGFNVSPNPTPANNYPLIVWGTETIPASGTTPATTGFCVWYYDGSTWSTILDNDTTDMQANINEANSPYISWSEEGNYQGAIFKWYNTKTQAFSYNSLGYGGTFSILTSFSTPSNFNLDEINYAVIDSDGIIDSAVFIQNGVSPIAEYYSATGTANWNTVTTENTSADKNITIQEVSQDASNPSNTVYLITISNIGNISSADFLSGENGEYYTVSDGTLSFNTAPVLGYWFNNFSLRNAVELSS